MAEKTKEGNVTNMLQAEHKKLGSMSFHEGTVALLFFAVIMLWIFRDPRIIKGWGPLFTAVEVDDATAAMLIVLLLFIIPRDPSFLFGSEKLLAGNYSNHIVMGINKTLKLLQKVPRRKAPSWTGSSSKAKFLGALFCFLVC